jgi:hypothetical protein
MSCGGNDLIDAFGVHGPGIPQAKRLLLEPAEWGAESLGAARYLSDAGWTTFCDYMKANLDHLVGMRDAPRSKSKGVPIFLHGYAFPTPRPSGAGPKMGPWLCPSVQACAVPGDEWIAVAQLLLQRLAGLLAGCAADAARYPNLHFFDTTTIAIEPAALGAEGESGDWVNEIHLTWRGYEKLAVPWAASIEKVLSQR